MYEHLVLKEQGRLVEVHLNRPQVRHALSRALMREITAVARALSERTDIGGLALSLACDWRVLAQDAFVSLPEIALGIPLTWGTIPRLVNLLGPAKAKRLTILCERIAAPEALSLGLVDYVSDKGQAMVRAQALAAQTLAQPAATLRMSKESVNAAATALNHATSYMAHDQIALAASSPESRAARGLALR
jgi:enoyl-CoA hydratase